MGTIFCDGLRYTLIAKIISRSPKEYEWLLICPGGDNYGMNMLKYLQVYAMGPSAVFLLVTTHRSNLKVHWFSLFGLSRDRLNFGEMFTRQTRFNKTLFAPKICACVTDFYPADHKGG